MLILFLIVALGCTASDDAKPAEGDRPRPSSSGADSSSEVALFLPRQTPVEGDRVVMESLFEGELFEEDGCLRIRSSSGEEGHTTVWPAGFTATQEDGYFAVYNGAGQLVARTDAEVRMGGGFADASSWVDDETEDRLRERCPSSSGEYWIVGESVEVVPTPSPIPTATDDLPGAGYATASRA